jgi:outer membrane immunogenic protein
MKILIAAAAAVSALALAAPASAEIYGSLGYSKIDSGHAQFDIVNVRASWKSASPIGAEGEVAFGVNEGDDTLGGVKLEFANEFAAYVTATAAANESFQVFARVGAGITNIKSTPGGGDNRTSWNYGVGGQWFFSGNNGLRADYTRHDFRGESPFEDADEYSISFVHRF